MLFKNKQNNLSNITLPILRLNNQIIERVNKFLYLGIYMDEDLTWEPHINHISNKISKNNGILRRLKHTVPKHILKTIYFSLIHPHLNYGTLLWGFNLERLDILQKKAIRIISHSYNIAHTSNLFKQLNILKVEDIFKLKQMVFYYKFIHNKLPNAIKNILTAETRILRLAHTAFFLKLPPLANTEYAKKCIRHSIPELINNSDKNVIDNLKTWSLPCLKIHFKSETL